MQDRKLARMLAGVLAALTLGIGLFTLGAWGLDRWQLVTMGSTYIPMAPITASLFVLLAVALGARLWWPERRAVVAATHAGVVVATLVSGAELVRWLWPITLPWDLWGFGVETGFGLIRIGQMAPLTAGVFILTILAYVGSGAGSARHRWLRYPASLAALAALLVGSLVILAYAAGTPLGYVQDTVPMAWLTALGFLAVNAGLLAASQGGGLWGAWGTGELESFEADRLSRAYRNHLWVALAVTGIAVGLAGFYYLRQRRMATRHAVQSQLEAVANLKVGQIQHWLGERLNDARVAAAMPGLQVVIENLAHGPNEFGTERTRVAEYLATMQRAYRYRQIVLYDRHLSPVLMAEVGVSGDFTLPPDMRRQISQAQEPLMNDLHRDEQQAVHLDFIAPVRDPRDSQLTGAVQLTVDASLLLYPLLQEWPSSSQSGETLIFRVEGNELVYLNELQGDESAALRLRLPVDAPTLLAARAVRSRSAGLIEGTDYRGTPVLGVARRVTGTSWFLVAKMDQREAYAEIRAEVITVLAAGLLITGLVALFLRGLWQERQRQLTRQQLHLERSSRAASERLAHLMRYAGEAILLFDEHMRIVETNQRALEVYGWTAEELTRLSAQDLRPVEISATTPVDFARVLAGPGLSFATTHQRKDGSTFPVEVNSRPVVIDGRRHVLSIVRDVSQRREQEEEIARLSRLYQVISQINKILLRTKNRETLFAEVCDVLVRIGHFRIAWIGLPDESAGMLRPVAVAGDLHGYVDGIRISADPSLPEGRGPSATAFREGRVVVCNDFFGDISTKPWHERAAKSDFASTIALPVRTQGRTIAMLAVYAREKNFFSPREEQLLEETVDNLAFALDLFAQDARRLAAEAESRKLSLAVEQSPSSIVITDLAGRIEYVNPRFTEVTGYSQAEVIGFNPRVLKSGLTAPEVYEDLWRTITQGASWRGEIVNRKKNGQYHIELVLISPVKDATGRASHYLAIKEDITERKRVEEALAASENKYRRLFSMVPLPMGHSDAQGTITFANERFYEAFGYDAADLTTVQAWLEHAYPDPQYRTALSEKWNRAVQQAAENQGQIAAVESIVTCKNGRRCTVEISGMLVGGEMLITFNDISERVRAEKKLRQLSRIVEQAPLSIAITNLDGVIEYVNPTFLQVTGYTEAEVLGQNPRVLKSGLTPAATYSDMWATLARGEVWSGELSNKKKNGEIYHERAVIAPVADETGRVTHYVALKEDVTKRKQIEDELRESNERFRSMFDSNLDGLLITVPAGDVLAANPAACAMLRRKETEICQAGHRSLVDPGDSRFSPLLEQRRRTGRARGVVTMLRGDGTRFEAEISLSVFGAGAGERIGMVLRDITERLKAEEALRESEARYRELFDLESDAILVFTIDTGRIVQANRAAVRLYGFPLEHLLTLTTADISADPEATRATREQISQQADQVLRIPLRQHRRSDGTVIPVEISMRSFRRDGQALAVGVVRDITEQVRARERLQRFNEELEAKVAERTRQIVAANNEMHALLQSIPDTVIRLTRGGGVLSYQPAKGATPLSGLVLAEGLTAAEGPSGALHALVRGVGAKTLAGNVVVVVEHELPLAAGTVAVELRAAPISPDEYVVFVRDVTERKRFEAEMAAMLEKEHQVSAMKTRFISVTSHEFRTPMAAALGSVELLTNHLDRLTPAKRGELLARISQSLGRMTEMLDEVLLLNRMDANRMEVRLAPVDLLPLVRNLIEEIKLGDRAGHVIELESSGVTAGFVTDASLVHHVFGNLLSNAVRYSAAGSRIEVRLTFESGMIRFAVEDHGIGIPAADLQRIFEPFERGSNVGNIKGTGLGLNIVKRMVDLLHGEIAVRSAPTGSCFTVSLPNQASASPAA